MSSNTNSLGYNGGRFYSSLVRPVLVDCSFVVDSGNANGLGIRNLRGSLVEDVFMYTSASAGIGNSGLTNPMAHTQSQGYALVKLKANYARFIGGFMGSHSPVSGGDLAINGTALTVGVPYIITAVGHGAAGVATIAPVADTAGSLASTWFRLYDGYGNTFIIWFKVSGLGAAPSNVSGTLVQQSIASGDTAATIGAALVLTIENLPSGIAGVFSFTASGTTTVTVTSTATNPYAPLPGVPADGLIATGFTFAVTVSNTNLTNWQAVGVPKGVNPVIGVSFVALATGSSSGGGSTGTVKLAGVSGISTIEIVGNPSVSLAPVPMGGSAHSGGWVLVKYLGQTLTMASYTPAGTVSAPTLTMNSYTPAGSVAAGSITVVSGTAGAAVTNNAGVLNNTGGGNLSVNAQAFTGTLATLTGTNSVPVFTGTPAVLTGTVTMGIVSPADESFINFSFYVEQSSVVIAGE